MRIRIFNSIREISQADWSEVTDPEFPFLSHAFLLALEVTGCLGTRTGWSPRIVTLWKNDKLRGALLAFLKDNSYGEYIFDFAWASLSERNGIPYYPKLTLAVPFTPATGRKILLSRDLNAEDRIQTSLELLQALQRPAENQHDPLPHSTHALFITPEETADFERAGFFIRHSFQFHWRNAGFSNFHDFLNSLKGKRRREILRERAQVVKSGVQISRFTGDALTLQHAKTFYRFYADTVEKRSGYDYLTAEFFNHVFTTMKDQVLLVLAESRIADGVDSDPIVSAENSVAIANEIDRPVRPVAGALFYFGNDALYGRHWGCLEEHRALHFELCYYQGIEFAIERGIPLFEAGAQGEHKFSRGFLPSLTYSAHRLEHPALNTILKEHVDLERIEIDRVIRDYQAHTPFQDNAPKPPAISTQT